MPADKEIRVMLVDDHKTMLWGLERLIESEKSRMEVVGTACNCDDARSQAGELRPDVILLDIDLGGKSSLDILPALLANGTSRVLIFTGSNEQSILDMAVFRGARGVVRKDASAELLLKAIRKVHQGELWIDHEMLGRVFCEFMAPTTARKSDPEEEKKAALTAKERKIIDAIIHGSGALNKTLAQRLFISEHTLRNHLTSIYQKLGVSNRLELYVYAVKHQLGSAPTDGKPPRVLQNTDVPTSYKQI
jgi:two-component system, NarL family, nitrate/nitrite response regulator NarL